MNDGASGYCTLHARQRAEERLGFVPTPDEWRAVAVATAILAETIPVEKVKADPFGNYTPGRFAWRLDDVRSVEPHIPAKGRQQIGWEWTPPEGFVP